MNASNLSLQVETLQRIETLAQAAVKASDRLALVRLPDEPPGTYGVVTPDGKFERVTAAPPVREHSLLSVDQIPSLVDRFQHEELAPSVWYSPDAVVIVLNDDLERRMDDRATCTLTHTAEFDALQEFEDGEKWLNQKQFIRLLRTKFADALGERLEPLVRTLRVLKFSTGTTGRGTVDHGRESLGRDIEAAVESDAGKIPDEVRMDLRIYTDPAIKTRFPVRVAIEIDPSAGAFSLLPLGDGLTRIVDDQMAALRELLEGLTCPVFYGTP